jgi:predicted transcriptional regulator
VSRHQLSISQQLLELPKRRIHKIAFGRFLSLAPGKLRHKDWIVKKEKKKKGVFILMGIPVIAWPR